MLDTANEVAAECFGGLSDRELLDLHEALSDLRMRLHDMKVVAESRFGGEHKEHRT